MKRIVLLCSIVLLFVSVFSSFAAAQNGSPVKDTAKISFRYPWLIKVNMFAFAFKKISVQGEYSINKKFSVALGLSYTPDKPIYSVTNAVKPFFYDLKFSSYSITPEFRWYPAQNSNSPMGFYLSPFVRLKRSVLKSGFTFNDSVGNNYKIPMQLSVNTIDLGLMIGYQWIFKNHLTLDWWIAGAQAGISASKFSVNTTNIINQPNIKPTVDKSFADANLPFWAEPVIKKYVEQTNPSFGWTQPNFGLRTGFTIGIVF